ncbi:hypothetical protein C8B47_23410, partial [filamentous cyanobacterium CCP4]
MPLLQYLATGLAGLAILGTTACYPLRSGNPFATAIPRQEDPNQLTAARLGVIVNRRNRLSGQIAEYYRRQRNIPPENLIWVEFDPGHTTLSVEAFAEIYAAVQAQTPDQVQAYALTWAQPYRVGCMSITAAFA